MGSSYKLSAIFLGGVTLHFVVIIPDEDEDGDLNIFYDGMGEPNNGGQWKPYVQTVKRRQKINTIRKCKDCDVGTVFYTKEIEEQSKKSNDDVAKIIHRLDSLIKPETIPSIEHIRKKHSWLFEITTTDAEIKNDNDDAAAHNSLKNENSSNKSNDVPTAASTLATDKSTKKTASTLAACKSTEEETDKVPTKAISPQNETIKNKTEDPTKANDNDDAAAHNSLKNKNPSNKSNDVSTAASTLATDKSTKKTASTLAASKSTEEETDKESNDVPTAASTLATDKSTKKAASTLAASKSTEEETDKVPTKAVSPQTEPAASMFATAPPTFDSLVFTPKISNTTKKSKRRTEILEVETPDDLCRQGSKLQRKISCSKSLVKDVSDEFESSEMKPIADDGVEMTTLAGLVFCHHCLVGPETLLVRHVGMPAATFEFFAPRAVFVDSLRSGLRPAASTATISRFVTLFARLGTVG
eukprot:scaffold379142_cov63-Cyclotella_meneghiniana.AAC.1